MKFPKLLTAVLICATALASDTPQGTVPRDSAGKYSAHAEQNELAIGASLLTSNQVHKIFTADLNRCCMVVEVALYPPKDGKVDVNLRDFDLRIAGDDTALRPSSVELVAATVQKQPSPPAPDIDAQTNSSIGVGTTTDPATGRRATSRTVSNGASVGIGLGGETPQQGSGSPELDRHAVELELRLQELPEGSATAPVAGYLYFSMARKKGAKYELDYTLGGRKLSLGLK